MKRTLVHAIFILVLSSCIPLKTAPNIRDFKIVDGNQFQESLPERTHFVFKDPKEEGQFYDYINKKYNLNGYRVDVDVPIEVNGQEFYFAYYEVERTSKKMNLLPIVLDGILVQTNTSDPILTDAYQNRSGYWYIAIEVYDRQENDGLAEGAESRMPLIAYLRKLKEEYLDTHNYNEVVLKN